MRVISCICKGKVVFFLAEYMRNICAKQLKIRQNIGFEEPEEGGHFRRATFWTSEAAPLSIRRSTGWRSEARFAGSFAAFTTIRNSASSSISTSALILTRLRGLWRGSSVGASNPAAQRH